jgi:hypothetical protein
LQRNVDTVLSVTLSSTQDRVRTTALAHDGGHDAYATRLGEVRKKRPLTVAEVILSKAQKTSAERIFAWTISVTTCVQRAALVVLLCAPRAAAVSAGSARPIAREWLGVAPLLCTRRVILLRASIA